MLLLEASPRFGCQPELSGPVLILRWSFAKPSLDLRVRRFAGSDLIRAGRWRLEIGRSFSTVVSMSWWDSGLQHLLSVRAGYSTFASMTSRARPSYSPL